MKKTIIFIAVVVIVTAGLIGLASYKYVHQPKANTITVSQALSQRDDALRALQIHDQINKNNLTGANNVISTLTAQKVTLCAQIKAAKLQQPLCQ